MKTIAPIGNDFIMVLGLYILKRGAEHATRLKSPCNMVPVDVVKPRGLIPSHVFPLRDCQTFGVRPVLTVQTCEDFAMCPLVYNSVIEYVANEPDNPASAFDLPVKFRSFPAHVFYPPNPGGRIALPLSALTD
jgi:hypothetical protein